MVKPLSAEVRQVLNKRRMNAEDGDTGNRFDEEEDSGILADYVRSLRDMEEHRPRHEWLTFPPELEVKEQKNSGLIQ